MRAMLDACLGSAALGFAGGLALLWACLQVRGLKSTSRQADPGMRNLPPAAELLSVPALDILVHELRTPLAALMGAADLLKQGMLGPLNDEQHYYLDKVLRQSDAIQYLLDDLVDMRRAQNGKLTLFPRWICPILLADDVLSDLEPLAKQASIRLVNAVPSALPVFRADPDRIRQVLTNLLSNALKFTPAGGQVTLDARVVGYALRMEVRDDGVGIAEEHLANLFTWFWQHDDGAGHRGLGLGLPICRILVEAHGGTMGVTSAPGQGSRFFFTLPLDPAAGPA